MAGVRIALRVAAVVVIAGALSAGTWLASGRRAAAPAVHVTAHAEAAVMKNFSLAGTTPDGGASASAADTLVLGPELIRLFEYYLVTVGERPLAEIRADIEHDLDSRLGPRAAQQARDVLTRYLGYKDAMTVAASPAAGNVSASVTTADRLRGTLQTMQEARARFFTPTEVATLFGASDATAQAALDRLAAEQDPVASPEERRRRLAALDNATPAAAEARDAREAAKLVTRLNEATQDLLAHGATEDDVYRMRAATVSPEAANRLADLDRDEAGWASRIADYQAQRKTLQSAPDGEAAIARLRQQQFTPEEQRRLPAYGG